MMKTLYKRVLSLTVAILITVVTGLNSIPVKATASEVPTYLTTVVRTVLGKAPILPSKVTIDGVAVTVAWDEISQGALDSDHRFWVNGTTESGKAVALRVQVDAHKVLDNFENSLTDDGKTVTGMVNWSGESDS